MNKEIQKLAGLNSDKKGVLLINKSEDKNGRF